MLPISESDCSDYCFPSGIAVEMHLPLAAECCHLDPVPSIAIREHHISVSNSLCKFWPTESGPRTLQGCWGSPHKFFSHIFRKACLLDLGMDDLS